MADGLSGSISREEERFIKSSAARVRRRRLTIAGLTAVSLGVLSAWGGATFYAEFARMTAFDCDLLAAEVDNNVGVRGVEFDSIKYRAINSGLPQRCQFRSGQPAPHSRACSLSRQGRAVRRGRVIVS